MQKLLNKLLLLSEFNNFWIVESPIKYIILNSRSMAYFLKNERVFENKVINQKFFYSNNEMHMSIWELLVTNLFKKSSSLWGFGRAKQKLLNQYYSSTVVLKKKMIKKSSINSNDKNNKNDLTNIISGGNKQIKQDFLLTYKIHKLTKDHPKFVEIIVDDNANHSAIIGNLTTSSKNSTYLASKGMLHTKEVYVYNQVSIEKLSNDNLNELEEIIIKNKDINYTNKVQSLLIPSNNLNKFIENKTNKKIFLKNVQIEEKIKRLKNYHDDIERMNSRED